MRELAPGLHQLDAWPANLINVYLLDDVLVDAGTRFRAPRLLKELRGRSIAAHALTHAHPDHQGSSARVCRELAIPCWCGAGDAAAVASGDLTSALPDSWRSRCAARWLGGPGAPVERTLREGDRVGSFTVLETPGHSPGHIAFWRERDRALVLGDVVFGLNVWLSPGLFEPLVDSTVDPALNRESIIRLAALSPALICFGHGPPIRTAGALEVFAERLLASAAIAVPSAPSS